MTGNQAWTCTHHYAFCTRADLIHSLFPVNLQKDELPDANAVGDVLALLAELNIAGEDLAKVSNATLCEALHKAASRPSVGLVCVSPSFPLYIPCTAVCLLQFQ